MAEFVADYSQRFALQMKEMKYQLVDELKDLQKLAAQQASARSDQLEKYLEQVHLSQVNEAVKVKHIQGLYDHMLKMNTSKMSVVCNIEKNYELIVG